MIEENPALYDLAKQVAHDFGYPWTDPRTGITYPAPAKGTQMIDKIGCLLAQDEGEYWAFYYSTSGQVQDAMKIGTVIALGMSLPRHRESHVWLMQTVASDLIEKATGSRPTGWLAPQELDTTPLKWRPML